MSTVGDIVAVLGELDLLINADPGALARRQEILATKSELLERIRAEGDAPVAVAVIPWRDDDATMPCPVCGSAFVVGGRRRYCSDGCRASAWARRRRSSPPPVVVMAPPGPRRPHTPSMSATAVACGPSASSGARTAASSCAASAWEEVARPVMTRWRRVS